MSAFTIEITPRTDADRAALSCPHNPTAAQPALACDHKPNVSTTGPALQCIGRSNELALSCVTRSPEPALSCVITN